MNLRSSIVTSRMVLFAAVLVFSLFPSNIYASDFSLPEMSLREIKALPALEIPVPALSPAPDLKEWTVMYFVNGKNNLESSALI